MYKTIVWGSLQQISGTANHKVLCRNSLYIKELYHSSACLRAFAKALFSGFASKLLKLEGGRNSAWPVAYSTVLPGLG